MLLLYYPVFVDVTGMIGKISSMQDSFSLAWLKDKIFEEWGERTTLLHTLPKIMQTLRQLGAVDSNGGVYTVHIVYALNQVVEVIYRDAVRQANYEEAVKKQKIVNQ